MGLFCVNLSEYPKDFLSLHSVIITFIIFHIEKTNDKNLR